jgi:hypothetical protein
MVSLAEDLTVDQPYFPKYFSYHANHPMKLVIISKADNTFVKTLLTAPSFPTHQVILALFSTIGLLEIEAIFYGVDCTQFSDL